MLTDTGKGHKLGDNGKISNQDAREGFQHHRCGQQLQLQQQPLFFFLSKKDYFIFIFIFLLVGG